MQNSFYFVPKKCYWSFMANDGDEIQAQVTMLRTQLDQIDQHVSELLSERDIVAAKFRMAMAVASEIPKEGETRYVGGKRTA